MSIYKFVELVGTSPTSWEDAARNVVAEAGRSLEELRIAEVVKFDLVVAKGKKVVALAAKEATLDGLKGPTGNYRAPMLRVGRKLLVGFHPETLEALLK